MFWQSSLLVVSVCCILLLLLHSAYVMASLNAEQNYTKLDVPTTQDRCCAVLLHAAGAGHGCQTSLLSLSVCCSLLPLLHSATRAAFCYPCCILLPLPHSADVMRFLCKTILHNACWSILLAPALMFCCTSPISQQCEDTAGCTTGPDKPRYTFLARSALNASIIRAFSPQMASTSCHPLCTYCHARRRV